MYEGFKNSSPAVPYDPLMRILNARRADIRCCGAADCRQVIRTAKETNLSIFAGAG